MESKKAMKVIFCNESRMHWEAIEDRLSGSGYNIQVLKVESFKDAVKAVPEEGKCIVLTESVLPGKEEVSQLPPLCKAKNPDSIVILYTRETYGMDVSSFDYYLNSDDRDSYQELFSVFRKYC
jgi:hypothetical protein